MSRIQAVVRALVARTVGRTGNGKRMTARDAGNVVFLWTGEIDWLQAEGDYVRVHAGRRSMLVRDTLQNMLVATECCGWSRVNESCPVTRPSGVVT